MSVTGVRIMTDDSADHLDLWNAQYLHQDQLMWGRTQLLIAIQVAVLGGAVTLMARQPGYAMGVLFLGCILTLATLSLVDIDEKVRDRIGTKLPPSLQMRSGARRLGGGLVLKWTLGMFAAIDFGLMFVVIFG